MVNYKDLGLVNTCLLYTSYTVIPIKNFSQEIEMDRILSDIQILRLNIPDTTFIGQIKDLAIYRDSIYILDDIKQSLFIFDMQGNFIQETCRSGRDVYKRQDMNK